MASSSHSLSSRASVSSRPTIVLDDEDFEESPSSRKRKKSQSSSHSAPSSPQPIEDDEDESSRQNPGGKSQVVWFNQLLDDQSSAAKNFKRRLINRLSESKISQPNGCIKYTGDKVALNDRKHPRVDPGSAAYAAFKSACPAIVVPVKINASHIALLKAGTRRPDVDTPACPQAFVQASGGALVEGRGNRWVASHLCHNKWCIQPNHIVWEPDWYNRARDNCVGQIICSNCTTLVPNSCQHIPPCMRPHRGIQIPDWHPLIQQAPVQQQPAPPAVSHPSHSASAFDWDEIF